MKRFQLDDRFTADCVISDKSRVGEIYHIGRNFFGGSTLTPIAYYFAWIPVFNEGFHKHWRIDCFVRQHHLSPDPIKLGESLVGVLVSEGLCEEPMWMSAHASQELGGKAYGDLTDD